MQFLVVPRVYVLMYIGFTIYYDYRNKGSDHKTIIQSVISGYSGDTTPKSNITIQGLNLWNIITNQK